jgi:hypothetical protein
LEAKIPEGFKGLRGVFYASKHGYKHAAPFFWQSILTDFDKKTHRRYLDKWLSRINECTEELILNVTKDDLAQVAVCDFLPKVKFHNIDPKISLYFVRNTFLEFKS